MSKDWSENDLHALTETIIGSAFKVHNTLGCGYLEKVYENALAHELRKRGLPARQQEAVSVFYDGCLVGDYFVDILVEDVVLVELKASTDHHSVYSAQCLNYLKATERPICLLLNFGKPRLDIKRFRGHGGDEPQMNTDEHR